PPQLVGSRLDIRDVDVGDAAVGRRLAFGEADLGGAAHEPCPAALVVHVRLHEPEPLLVEAHARIQVAHRVPDDHSASPGYSSVAFNVCRKPAPAAPSTARWSHVSVSVSIGRT